MYLELAGGGGAFSLNYERLIAESVALRIGAGLLYLELARAGTWASAVSFPLTASVLAVRSGRNALELGGGVTVLAPVDSESAGALRYELGRDTLIIAIPTLLIGYRTLHPSFRIAVTPFISPIRVLHSWGGIAIGSEF